MWFYEEWLIGVSTLSLTCMSQRSDSKHSSGRSPTVAITIFAKHPLLNESKGSCEMVSWMMNLCTATHITSVSLFTVDSRPYPVISNLPFVDWQFGVAPKDKNSVGGALRQRSQLLRIAEKRNWVIWILSWTKKPKSKLWLQVKRQRWPSFCRSMGVQQDWRWPPLQGRAALLSGAGFFL